MKEKKICKIIQDLLPNYIENLTSVETNNYIDEHLEGCSECKTILKNMQKEFEVNSQTINKREIKYIKKYSNKIKALKFILLVIVIIYALIVGRKTIILVSLSEKVKENQYNNNYYAEIHSYQGNAYTILETYNIGEDYIVNQTKFSEKNQFEKYTYYKKGNEKIALSQINESKYLLDSEATLGNIMPIMYQPMGVIENLLFALFEKVDTDYCNGIPCYIIDYGDNAIYYDKETGLAIRNIYKSTKDVKRSVDTLVDYEYKYNVVKESDIKKPDTTSYIVNQ